MKKIVVLMAAVMFTSLVGNYVYAEDVSNEARHKPKFHQKHMEHFKQKREELREKLNLTEEQKEKAKQLRMEARPAIKPIIEKLRQEKHELREMQKSGASKEELKTKIEKIKSLRQEANKIREKNMKKFEAILDSQQKAEFKKHKKEMEKNKEKFRQKRKEELKEKRKERRNFDMHENF